MAGLFNEFNPMSKVPTNQFGFAADSTITKGSLISFNYPRSMAIIPNVIHDVKPMIIVTDVWPNYIRGVNLHYLKYPQVRQILTDWAGNAGFSWTSIRTGGAWAAQRSPRGKGRALNPFEAAFRMYVRAGVSKPRKLDAEWLKSILKEVRSFDPGEIEKIRATIQKQIQMRLQAKAKELTSYEQWRKSLTDSQQRQLRGKVKDIQDTLTRGYTQGLVQDTTPDPIGQQMDEMPPDVNESM